MIEDMKQIAIVIPSFRGADRTAFLLDTIKQNDPEAFTQAHWLVMEDYTGDRRLSEDYDMLADRYPVRVEHLLEWSNMHGAAAKAFDYVIDKLAPEWIVYLGDDLAVTPGALSNMMTFLQENDLKTVSLVQFPYWNAHDLCETHDSEWPGPKLFWSKERDFYANTDWTRKVPRNPHWEGEPPHFARPYVNVNGVGFACRASTYEAVGGFAKGTWCLDESISVRTWLKSDQSIVCLPGPPLVHYFGASTRCDPPKHDLHTEERWIEAMGMSKQEAGERSYKAMFEREAAVNAEMEKARYWNG